MDELLHDMSKLDPTLNVMLCVVTVSTEQAGEPDATPRSLAQIAEDAAAQRKEVERRLASRGANPQGFVVR
jgi:hypothetical protein